MDYYLFYYKVKSDEQPVVLRDQLINYSGKRAVFDFERIICLEQIRIAVDRTIRAEDRKKMIANNWGIELMLHLTGTHQISEALKVLNINNSTKIIGIVQDQNQLPLPDAEEGFFDLELEEKRIMHLRDIYGINGKDLCSEIISKGVNVVLNHE